MRSPEEAGKCESGYICTYLRKYSIEAGIERISNSLIRINSSSRNQLQGLTDSHNICLLSMVQNLEPFRVT